MNKIYIRYSMMANPIKEQLKKQGIEIETDEFDKIHNAIQMLFFNEYISEKQMKKFLAELGNSIQNHISMLKKEDEENE